MRDIELLHHEIVRIDGLTYQVAAHGEDILLRRVELKRAASGKPVSLEEARTYRRTGLRGDRRLHVRYMVRHAIECQPAHLPGVKIYQVKTRRDLSSIFEVEIFEAVRELQAVGCVLPVCITSTIA